MREAGHNLAAVRIGFSGPYRSSALAPMNLTSLANIANKQALRSRMYETYGTVRVPYPGPYVIMGGLWCSLALPGP